MRLAWDFLAQCFAFSAALIGGAVLRGEAGAQILHHQWFRAFCFGVAVRNKGISFSFRFRRLSVGGDGAIAGSNRTKLRRALRLSKATMAWPLAVNARPSGLPLRSPNRQAEASAAIPPPGLRSSIRAMVAD